MADVSKFFRIRPGLSLDDSDTSLFSGSVDPNATAEQAPIGSLFLRTNGEVWVCNVGSPTYSWKKLSYEKTPFKQYLNGNGTNQLTLSYTPLTDSSLLFINGAVQVEGVDYTISGTTITFSGIVAIAKKVYVKYWY